MKLNNTNALICYLFFYFCLSWTKFVLRHLKLSVMTIISGYSIITRFFFLSKFNFVSIKNKLIYSLNILHFSILFIFAIYIYVTNFNMFDYDTIFDLGYTLKLLFFHGNFVKLIIMTLLYLVAFFFFCLLWFNILITYVLFIDFLIIKLKKYIVKNINYSSIINIKSKFIMVNLNFSFILKSFNNITKNLLNIRKNSVVLKVNTIKTKITIDLKNGNTPPNLILI